MRPLVPFVIAESALLAWLVLVWLDAPPATPAPAAVALPAAAGDAALAPAAIGPTDPAAPAPSSAGERRDAPAAVPSVVADDPLGILVWGRVRSTDGTPVAGAIVGFRRDKMSRVGGAAGPGAYAASALQPGEWTLNCRAEGFAEHESVVTLDERAFQQIDLELRPAYLVRVRIQDHEGQPLLEEFGRRSPFGMPYVVATEAPLGGDPPPTEHSRLVRFGLGKWRGAYDMGSERRALREQGFAGELLLSQPPPLFAALLLRTTLLQSQRIEPGQRELVFSIALADLEGRLGTVRLRLLDGLTGAPIVGAMLRLETAQGGGAAGKADAEGRVVIERALPGLCSLQLWHSEQYEGIARHVRVPPGGVLDLGDVLLSPALQLSGIVRDADGRPAGGGNVIWTEVDSRSPTGPLIGSRSSGVGADGRFELHGCGRHRYAVHVRSAAGAGFALIDARTGAPQPVTITLAPPTRITLRARLAPTDGYAVTVLAPDQTPAAVALLGGDFPGGAVEVPPGSYTLAVHDLHTERLVRSFALQVGSEPLAIEVP